jgi:predicted MFS family arabinose efflux permease
MVGIYNCTWASAAALAFFGGGWLYDASSKVAVFWFPALIFLGQLIFVTWLERRVRAHVLSPTPPPAVPEPPPHPEPEAFRQPVSPQTFLRMAWLANPFAYVAINTLFAVIPAIGARLGLSPTQVGLFCSVWLFGRFAAFVALWQWSGWHYRFRWMLAAFVALVVSFLAIVLAQALWVVVVAQLLFGFATGTAYYASLFYSMDAGEAKGEHGGLHEAAIGAGICGGPLIGALALTLTPNTPNVGVWAVAGLLLLGLLALVWLRLRPAR